MQVKLSFQIYVSVSSKRRLEVEVIELDMPVNGAHQHDRLTEYIVLAYMGRYMEILFYFIYFIFFFFIFIYFP